MSYIYSEVDSLDNTAKVGNKQCVALVQYYAKASVILQWKEVEIVFGASNIAKGTAIATFINGKYPNLRHGNHAALYISQDASGIYVMDQWLDDKTKPKVSRRYIRRKGKKSDGSFVDPSNNAEAFSVIERK